MDDVDGLFSAFDDSAAPKKRAREEDDASPPAAKRSKVAPAAKTIEIESAAAQDVEDVDMIPEDEDDDRDRPEPLTMTATAAMAVPPAINMPTVVTEQSPAEMIGEVFQPKVTHETAYPVGWVPNPDLHNKPVKPAREYPFTLDPFQRKSIDALEKNESVLVSAHTSAGKTVVAEYAIAMALRDKQRVIYTSPIKALSNQKYRDLMEEFQDVGLMTGDVTINPNASCLVMTTEILRSMLYRGSEIMREVAWVIFDEIHYMRDKERGVVWEETIILLPDKVHYVFLSATIPNALEFAQWICKIHSQPVHVVYTDMRPTPLQHYIFPAGGDGLYLVVDEKSQFREDNFQKAITSLQPAPTDPKERKKQKKKPTGGPSDMYKIVKMIMERHYEPVIIFAFSKKDCEAMAMQLSQLDFNDDNEKSMVESVFSNAIDSLSDDDRNLPQIENILPLLKRGIGIHHSGLLPILKEIIEILFQEGLVKALFATETFSMGLNMPAKTVVFTSVRKFDGATFRWVSGGEYIQMSGRAGRRGLDERGIVILMVDEKMEPAVAKSMLKGQSDPLNSSFYVGYGMLLNMLRMEDVNPEYMLARSFHQFQNERQVPALQAKIAEATTEMNSIHVEDEKEVKNYHHLRVQIEKLRAEMRTILNQPIYAVPYLQPGRLARVKDGEEDWGWGVIVNFQKRTVAKKAAAALEESSVQYVVDLLLNCAPKGPNEGPQSRPRPCPKGQQGEMQVVPVLLELLDGISSYRMYIKKDLRPLENRQKAQQNLREMLARFPNGIPLVDPVEDMQIESETFQKVIKKIETLESLMFSSPVHKSPTRDDRFMMYQRKALIEDQIKDLTKKIHESTHMYLQEEMKSMKRVLRRLNFVSSENVIELKGRVACEINAADELFLTDLIFNGVFGALTTEQTAALLSCFVFQEKSEENVRLKQALAGPLRQMQEAAKRIAKVKQESKIEIDVDEYVQSFKPHLMDVVHAWAAGAKFADICGMTDVFEGSIIRAMRRLEELMRQLVNAAKVIGNPELETKFAEGITKIKRDIVFAASLYL